MKNESKQPNEAGTATLPLIAQDFPFEALSVIAGREQAAPKPVYTLHKWWAPRPGITFRTILALSIVRNIEEIVHHLKEMKKKTLIKNK